MKNKYFLLSSVIALPIAFVGFWFMDTLVKSLLGGQAAVAGFPITYYYDDWAKPGVEFNLPALQILNFLLFYIPTIFIVKVIINAVKPKSKNSPK